MIELNDTQIRETVSPFEGETNPVAEAAWAAQLVESDRSAS